MNITGLRQIRDYIVRPTLEEIGYYSKSAERLIIGTGLAESGFKYVRQLHKGPARSWYQMELATHDDIWRNFLKFKKQVESGVEHLLVPGLTRAQQLHGNAYYATAMCRVHYLRVPARLPDADDLNGLAEYWKKYYNTVLGAGTVSGFKKKTSVIMKL